MYKTSDIGLATSIVCLGVLLDHAEPVTERKAEFVFTDETQSYDLFEAAYYANELYVPSRLFLTQYKFLKTKAENVLKHDNSERAEQPSEPKVAS